MRSHFVTAMVIAGLAIAGASTNVSRAHADEMGIKSSLALGGIYLEKNDEASGREKTSLGPKRLRYHTGRIIRHNPRRLAEQDHQKLAWRKSYRRHGRPTYEIHKYDGYVIIFRHDRNKRY